MKASLGLRCIFVQYKNPWHLDSYNYKGVTSLIINKKFLPDIPSGCHRHLRKNVGPGLPLCKGSWFGLSRKYHQVKQNYYGKVYTEE